MRRGDCIIIWLLFEWALICYFYATSVPCTRFLPQRLLLFIQVWYISDWKFRITRGGGRSGFAFLNSFPDINRVKQRKNCKKLQPRPRIKLAVTFSIYLSRYTCLYNFMDNRFFIRFSLCPIKTTFIEKSQTTNISVRKWYVDEIGQFDECWFHDIIVKNGSTRLISLKIIFSL